MLIYRTLYLVYPIFGFQDVRFLPLIDFPGKKAETNLNFYFLSHMVSFAQKLPSKNKPPPKYKPTRVF